MNSSRNISRILVIFAFITMVSACQTTKTRLNPDKTYKVAAAFMHIRTKSGRSINSKYCNYDKNLERCIAMLHPTLEDLAKKVCGSRIPVEANCRKDTVNGHRGVSCTGMCKEPSSGSMESNQSIKHGLKLAKSCKEAGGVLVNDRCFKEIEIKK